MMMIANYCRTQPPLPAILNRSCPKPVDLVQSNFTYFMLMLDFNIQEAIVNYLITISFFSWDFALRTSRIVAALIQVKE